MSDLVAYTIPAGGSDDDKKPDDKDKAKSSSPEKDLRDHALNVERLQFDREKHVLTIEESIHKRVIEDMRAVDARMDKLLGIVKYLNEVSQEFEMTIEEGHQTTNVKRPARHLDDSERVLLKSCMEELQSMVTGILPERREVSDDSVA